MHNNELTSAPACQRRAKHSANKHRILILLLVYSGVIGAAVSFVPENNPMAEVLIGMPLLILGVAWCVTDAAERGRRIGFIMKLLLILLFIIGLPVYLFRTRGTGAFKSLGWILLLVAAMSACSIISELATLYIGEIAGFWVVEY